MPSWNSGSDWDGNTNDDGVIHESVSGTDHNDSGTVKRGYSIESPYLSNSLEYYWTLHDGGGSTAHEHIQGSDGTHNSVTSAPGVLGTSASVYDGSAYTELPSLDSINWSGSNSWSITAWMYIHSSHSGSGKIFHPREEADWSLEMVNDDYFRFGYWGTSGNMRTSTVISSRDTWIFGAGTYDAANNVVRIYTNGNQQNSASGGGGPYTGVSGGNHIGARSSSNNQFDGRIAELRLYNKQLSTNEVQSIYNVEANDGTFTSGWKNV